MPLEAPDGLVGREVDGKVAGDPLEGQRPLEYTQRSRTFHAVLNLERNASTRTWNALLDLEEVREFLELVRKAEDTDMRPERIVRVLQQIVDSLLNPPACQARGSSPSCAQPARPHRRISGFKYARETWRGAADGEAGGMQRLQECVQLCAGVILQAPLGLSPIKQLRLVTQLVHAHPVYVEAPELLRAVDEGLHASEPALDDVIRETLCSQTHAVASVAVVLDLYAMRPSLCTQRAQLQQVLEYLASLSARDFIQADEDLLDALTSLFHAGGRPRSLADHHSMLPLAQQTALDLALKLWGSELINARMLGHKVVERLVENRVLEELVSEWWSAALDELLGARFDDRLMQAAAWVRKVTWKDEDLAAFLTRAQVHLPQRSVRDLVCDLLLGERQPPFLHKDSRRKALQWLRSMLLDEAAPGVREVISQLFSSERIFRFTAVSDDALELLTLAIVTWPVDWPGSVDGLLRVFHVQCRDLLSNASPGANLIVVGSQLLYALAEHNRKARGSSSNPRVAFLGEDTRVLIRGKPPEVVYADGTCRPLSGDAPPPRTALGAFGAATEGRQDLRLWRENENLVPDRVCGVLEQLVKAHEGSDNSRAEFLATLQTEHALLETLLSELQRFGRDTRTSPAGLRDRLRLLECVLRFCPRLQLGCIEVHLLCDSLLAAPHSEDSRAAELREELCAWLRSALCFTAEDARMDSQHAVPAGPVFPPGDVRPARALINRLEPYLERGGRRTYDCFVALFLVINGPLGESLLELEVNGERVDASYLVRASPSIAPCDNIHEGARVKVQCNTGLKDAVVVELMVEQAPALRVGSRVEAYYELQDGGRSDDTDQGHLLGICEQNYEVLFDDGVRQKVPHNWVLTGRRDSGSPGGAPLEKVVVDCADGWRETVLLHAVVGRQVDEASPLPIRVTRATSLYVDGLAGLWRCALSCAASRTADHAGRLLRSHYYSVARAPSQQIAHPLLQAGAQLELLVADAAGREHSRWATASVLEDKLRGGRIVQVECEGARVDLDVRGLCLAGVLPEPRIAPPGWRTRADTQAYSVEPRPFFDGDPFVASTLAILSDKSYEPASALALLIAYVRHARARASQEPPHASRCRGLHPQHLALRITFELPQRKSIVQVKVEAHSTMTVAKLRDCVAEEIAETLRRNQTYDAVTLRGEDLSLSCSCPSISLGSLQQTLKEVGLCETEDPPLLKATLVPEGRANAGADQPLIGEDLAAEDKQFEVLWRCVARDAAGSHGVWELVQLLPTQHSLVREITGDRGPADWKTLLGSSQPGGLWRVLYALQVVDGQLRGPDTLRDSPGREGSAWETQFVRSGGLNAVLNIMHEFASVRADSPLVASTAPILFRTLNHLLRTTPSATHFNAEELGGIVHAVVAVTLLAVPDTAVDKVHAVENGLDTLRRLLEGFPEAVTQLGAAWLQQLVRSLLPALAHPSAAIRRLLLKLLDDVASRDACVLGPLLEALPEIVERDVPGASSGRGRESAQLLAGLLNRAGLTTDPAARRVVLRFAEQIGTTERATVTGAAVLSCLLRAGTPWLAVLLESQDSGPLLPRQWLERCMLHELGGMEAQQPMERPLGSRTYRPSGAVAQPIERLLTCFLRGSEMLTRQQSLVVLHEIADALDTFLRKSPPPPRTADDSFEWEYDPEEEIGQELCSFTKPRNYTDRVGLRNHGNTCYLNSVTQQLFAIPAVRQLVLGTQIPPLAVQEGMVVDTTYQEQQGNPSYELFRCTVSRVWEKDESITVRYEDGTERTIPLSWVKAVRSRSEDNELKHWLVREIQRVFRYLQDGGAGLYDPQGLVRATDQALRLEFDAREQNDAAEYFEKLVDVVSDVQKKCTPPMPTLETVLEGKRVRYKQCLECQTKTKNKEEQFLSMQLECRSVLREFHHINACLEHWVASETLSGDNCVECENCQRKTETKLWYVITQLPDYLVIHLKRFDLNLETLQPEKLYHRLEFSTYLDLSRYCAEDLPGGREYELQGVVVHSGSCHGGHYYSCVTPDRKDWFELNDELSLRFDPDGERGLEAECFGGDYVTRSRKTNRPQTSRRRASAYMLVYAKRDRRAPPDPGRALARASSPERAGADSPGRGRPTPADRSPAPDSPARRAPGEVPPAPIKDDEFWKIRDLLYRQQVVYTDNFARLLLEVANAGVTHMTEARSAPDENPLSPPTYVLVTRLSLRCFVEIVSRMKSQHRVHKEWQNLLPRMVQLAPLDLSESVLKDVRERRWLPLLVDCPHGGTRNVVVTCLRSAMSRTAQASEDLLAEYSRIGSDRPLPKSTQALQHFVDACQELFEDRHLGRCRERIGHFLPALFPATEEQDKVICRALMRTPFPAVLVQLFMRCYARDAPAVGLRSTPPNVLETLIRVLEHARREGENPAQMVECLHMRNKQILGEQQFLSHAIEHHVAVLATSPFLIEVCARLGSLAQDGIAHSLGACLDGLADKDYALSMGRPLAIVLEHLLRASPRAAEELSRQIGELELESEEQDRDRASAGIKRDQHILRVLLAASRVPRIGATPLGDTARVWLKQAGSRLVAHAADVATAMEGFGDPEATEPDSPASPPWPGAPSTEPDSPGDDSP